MNLNHILIASRELGVGFNDVQLVVKEAPENNYYPNSHGYEIAKNWRLKVGDTMTVGQVCEQQDEYLEGANFSHFNVVGVDITQEKLEALDKEAASLYLNHFVQSW